MRGQDLLSCLWNLQFVGVNSRRTLESWGLPAGGETWGGLGRMPLMITTLFIKHSLWARHWAKQTNIAFHDYHEANVATSPLLQKR